MILILCRGSPKMAEKKRTTRDKILSRLKRGQSRREIADILGVSYQTVRGVSDDAERAGLIVRILNSHPLLFYDPADESIGYATKKQGVAQENQSDNLRISRVHLNGHFTCDVLHVGEKKQVNHGNKIAIIWRSEPSHPSGRIDHYGTYRTDGQNISFCYRKGKTSQTFAIWAGDIEISGANAMARGAELLKQRAEWVVSLLRSAGWRLTDPVLKGQLHSAHVGAPFAQYCADTVDDNAPLQVDKSTGTLEAEVFNDIDNDIIAYLPEHIKEMRARISAMEGITAKVITVTENLTRALAETTAHITTLVTSTLQQQPINSSPETDAPEAMYQ